MPERAIEKVLQAYTDELMALPGVVGAGQGRSQGQPCIKVFVTGRTAELEAKIPRELEGYAVVVEETGPFQALDPG